MYKMNSVPNKTPWKWVAVKGGWDGVADADGHVLFNMAENNPVNAEFLVQAVNSHEALKEALKAFIKGFELKAAAEASNDEKPDPDPRYYMPSCLGDPYDLAKAALALAEGREP